jgi:hypothetical protein
VAEASKLTKVPFGPAIAGTAWETAIPSFLKGCKHMLWTICVILFVLWALGMVTSYTLGGVIHVLLVLALIVLVFQIIQGRRSIV